MYRCVLDARNAIIAAMKPGIASHVEPVYALIRQRGVSSVAVGNAPGK
jgi:hypothetical protein